MIQKVGVRFTAMDFINLSANMRFDFPEKSINIRVFSVALI